MIWKGIAQQKWWLKHQLTSSQALGRLGPTRWVAWSLVIQSMEGSVEEIGRNLWSMMINDDQWWSMSSGISTRFGSPTPSQHVLSVKWSHWICWIWDASDLNRQKALCCFNRDVFFGLEGALICIPVSGWIGKHIELGLIRAWLALYSQ